MGDALKTIKRYLKKIFSSNQVEWKELEYFDIDWKDRIKLMSKYIHDGDVVSDLGCGQMWLKDYLPKQCIYIPVDYVKRDSETIVCDFNKGEFPELKVNVFFLSGCFEYIVDYTSFVKYLYKFSDRVIISYVSFDSQPNIQKRLKYAWKNHLTRDQFIKIFIRNGFRLAEHEDGRFFIYHFIREDK